GANRLSLLCSSDGCDPSGQSLGVAALGGGLHCIVAADSISKFVSVFGKRGFHIPDESAESCDHIQCSVSDCVAGSLWLAASPGDYTDGAAGTVVAYGRVFRSVPFLWCAFSTAAISAAYRPASAMDGAG